MSSSSGPFSRLINELDEMYESLESMTGDEELLTQVNTLKTTVDQSRKQIRRIVKTLDIQVPGILNY